MVLRLLCALLLSAASAFQQLSARRRHGTALRATRWFVKTEQFCAPFPVVKPHLEAHRAWVTELRDGGATITSGYRVDGEGKPGGGGMLFSPPTPTRTPRRSCGGTRSSPRRSSTGG
ncbi:YCII-related domain containing protein [Aureococcus anophagefferens]|nr:YCII-related domain containing protein [Aureococcus anophagefferens]